MPITVDEEKQRANYLKKFEYFRIFAVIGSYVMGHSAVKLYVRAFYEGQYGSPSSVIIPSSICSIIGLVISTLVANYKLFEATEYLRLRIYYEKSINFDRTQVKEKYEEYPFAGKVEYLLSDFEIQNKISKKGKFSGKKKSNKINMGEDGYQEIAPRKRRGEDVIENNQVESEILVNQDQEDFQIDQLLDEKIKEINKNI